MAINILANGGGGGGGGVTNVFLQKQQPSPNTAVGGLWIPLNNDNTPKDLPDWQVYAPDLTPGIALSALYAWYGAPYVNDKVNGDSIQRWADLSGNGHHLTQNVVSKQPIYTTSVVGGQPVIRFTEASGTALSQVTNSQAQPFELFMVFNVRRDANAQKTNIFASNNGSHGISWDLAAGGGARSVATNFGNFYLPPNTTLPLTWHAWRFEINGASTRTFRDSTDTPLGAAGNGGSTGLTQSMTLGSISGCTTDIDIAEVVISNRTLTTLERSAVHSYLQALYGTA
jgi:hypothetical protein